MSTLHSIELFEKNPNIKKEFPLLILDVNNNHCIPPRLKFHEMHWHEDIQITYVIHGTIQVQTLDHSLEVQVGQAYFHQQKNLTSDYRNQRCTLSFLSFSRYVYAILSRFSCLSSSLHIFKSTFYKLSY